MEPKRKPNGRLEVRWREGGKRCGRTFDRKRDAKDFITWVRRRKQLGQAAVADDVPLSEFVETYWRLHAVPNLALSTRELYKLIWVNHIKPRLGDYGVRELTPKRLTRFRAELERAGIGTATAVKAMSIVQSILSFAISEEIVEYNAAAVVRKPRYERQREPHVFLPAKVENIRRKLNLRDRTLVSVLAYSGARPRGSRLPALMGRRGRQGSPLRRHEATSCALHSAAESIGRGSARMVPRLGPAGF
jgi:integrase